MTELTKDYSVEGYNRVGKSGKRHSVIPHERGGGKTPKEKVLEKVKYLKATKKRVDPVLRNRQIKILNEDLKQLKKSLTKARKEDRLKDFRLIFHEIEKRQKQLDRLMLQKLGFDLIPIIFREDSKTIGEWISCCMHKHGPKGDGTMTHKQCIAAAHQKFGKSKSDLEDKRPPKAWWDACYKEVKKGNPEYNDEQIRKTCGMIYHQRGVREKMGDLILTPIIIPFLRTDNVPFSEFRQLKTDFENQDFVIFHGPIVRDGPYDYPDEKGNTKTLFKEIENLRDIYSRYKYLPIKASEEVGAHYAEELGYGTNFSFNKETNEIEADLVLVNDENFKDILSKKEEYHVSPGYNDIIKGNVQFITDVDHIALSLGTEIGRACTGTNSKGVSCTKVKKINHDQNLTEVV